MPKHWFGDDETSCDESSDETSEDEKEKEDSNWQDIKRKERNKNKKKVKKERQRRLKMEMTQKAARMLGIGPICQEDIEEHMGKWIRYETAKMGAVTKYLREQLDYEEDEIMEMRIIETKAAKDDIVYIAVENQDTIRNLYRRKVDLRNDYLIFCTFIPPQYYARYMAISNICGEKRKLNTDLKTQMWFAHKDIEVLTKQRGDNEPFRVVDLVDFIGDNQVPEFDHKIKWRHVSDRPQRKIHESSPTAPDRPASRNKRSDEPVMNDNSDERNPLVRQRSVGDDIEVNKRSKTTAMIIVDKDGSFGTPMERMNIEDIE